MNKQNTITDKRINSFQYFQDIGISCNFLATQQTKLKHSQNKIKLRQNFRLSSTTSCDLPWVSLGLKDTRDRKSGTSRC